MGGANRYEALRNQRLYVVTKNISENKKLNYNRDINFTKIANLAVFAEGDKQHGSLSAILTALTLTPSNYVKIDTDPIILNINLTYSTDCLAPSHTIEYLYGKLVRVDKEKSLTYTQNVERIKAIKIKILERSNYWHEYVHNLLHHLNNQLINSNTYKLKERPTEYIIIRKDQNIKEIDYYMDINAL
jgi:hypothetical protein